MVVPNTTTHMFLTKRFKKQKPYDTLETFFNAMIKNIKIKKYFYVIKYSISTQPN
jgi:hypothetical protein